MIKSLRLNGCFVHVDKTFDFETGLTAITGPNESGKSLILELIRYALFGAKALRGSVTDYKKSTVELDFLVRGVDYKVVRENGKATLTSGDETLATGTSVVNEKIPTLLGYDLRVFDVANICNQGDVEALTSMKPGERKNMIDQTIGLTAVDDCIATVGNEISAYRKIHESLVESLVEPTRPDAPEAYQPSAEISELESSSRRDAAEYSEVKGWLSGAGVLCPERPSCLVEEDVATLEEHERLRLDQTQRLAVARAESAAFPAVGYDAAWVDDLEKRIEAWERWCDARDFLSTQVESEYSAAQLNEWIEDLKIVEAWDEMEALQARIDALVAKGEHECPKCHHTWPFEQDSIAHLDQEMKGYHYLAKTERPEKPPLALDQIQFEIDLIDAWESERELREKFSQVPEVEDPGHTRGDLEVFRRQLEGAEKALEAQERLKALEAQETLPDRSEDLQARRRHQDALIRYQDDLKVFQEYEAKAEVKRKRLQELEGAVERHQEISTRLQQALVYEKALEAYQREQEKYLGAEKAADEAKATVEEYERARKALKMLKSRVKAYLVPSLNSVASGLLAQMTNGARTSIVINEEFEIMVDGQPINTLSGSGKAVANLAIRVGLGQVLTNRVFSVFMGDEIDASMDPDRADYTASCFQNLAESIKQVILVSHKTPEADHYIQL